jgi:endonuclease/exonuclease/phosphatase family metal-dependent hydrolase
MMSRIRWALVAVTLAWGAMLAAAEPLRVMSFNVRNSNAQDGENVWSKRTELFFGTIERFKPDLIGFQEVLANQYDAIVARMPGYAFSGVARNDGKRSGEWSMVAYRQDRFQAIKHGDFWLSETPDVIGSKSWDAAITRICSWARLREKDGGREFVFANTHFDHKGVVARAESSRLLTTKLTELGAGGAVILTGDLNINEDNPAYTVLVRPEAGDTIRWTDAYRAVHPKRLPGEASFHGFKGTVAGSRIDFVFHTSHFTATAATIEQSPAVEGRWASDHYAVTAVLNWKQLPP